MKARTTGIIGRFLEVSSVRTLARRDLSEGTQDQYIGELKKFWRWCGKKPSSEWGGPDVEKYMHWMRGQMYSRSSRKTALCAIVYVFRHVLMREIGKLNLPAMPKEKKTIKIIPNRQEIGQIFAGMKGMVRIMAGLLYGSGLRVSEVCELRVKDIDIDDLTIRIYDAKNDKNRLCLLPRNMVASIQRQITWRAALHERDLSDGGGFVEMPGRQGVKNKSASRDLRWQYLFPSAVIRGQHRWHTTAKALQKAMAVAVRAAGILKIITPHTLRHAYCTHSQQVGNDIATVAELMGHESIETTQIYSHADAARGVSPMDVVPLLMTKQRPGVSALLSNAEAMI